MVDFVAHRAGEKALCDERLFLTVPIEKLYLDHVGAGDDAVLSAHGQTTLETRLAAPRFDDDGIDELEKPFVHVHHHRAAQNTHLRRGEPRALFFFYGIFEIVQKHPQLFVERSHFETFFTQDVVAYLHNFSDCHFAPLLHMYFRAT